MSKDVLNRKSFATNRSIISIFTANIFFTNILVTRISVVDALILQFL